MSMQDGLELGLPILRQLGCEFELGSAVAALSLVKFERSEGLEVFRGELVRVPRPLANYTVDGSSECGRRIGVIKSRWQKRGYSALGLIGEDSSHLENSRACGKVLSKRSRCTRLTSFTRPA